jgi:hypothetical protein
MNTDFKQEDRAGPANTEVAEINRKMLNYAKALTTNDSQNSRRKNLRRKQNLSGSRRMDTDFEKEEKCRVGHAAYSR